ncbi:hypothetical protein COY87_01120, partial [Candidatus Roizmanbacteria bacterium CG_4_10_14_0_8_um_filter_33_9]
MSSAESKIKPTPKDIFLGNTTQPKSEICRQVSALTNGEIKIPSIVQDVDEVRAVLLGGETLLARSEHPDEYEGASGIFHTFSIAASNVDGRDFPGWEKKMKQFPDQITSFLVDLHKANHQRYVYYARLQGLDPESYLKGLSFSYWRPVQGVNLAINADSSIEGRYHISAIINEENWIQLMTEEKEKNVHALSQQGKTTFSQDELKELLRQYNLIRKLPIFDPKQCPIMEFQLGKNNVLYFLQYHRTREFEPPQFTATKEAEHIRRFVRGVTPATGIIVPTVVYAGFYPGQQNTQQFAPTIASFPGSCCVYHAHMPFQTWLSQQLEVQFINGFTYTMRGYHDGHLSRSTLFKPKVVIEIEAGEIEKLTEGQRRKITLKRYNDKYEEYIEAA